MASTGIFSKEAQDHLFEREERHFWFRSRAEFIIGRLKHLGLLSKDHEVAEIGCGNGYTSSKLMNYYKHYCATEGSSEALRNMQARLNNLGIDTSLYTLKTIDLSKEDLGNKYDIVFAFDVLEHIPPDQLDIVLAKIYQSLKPEGNLVITVPAFMWLWTSIDDSAGHYQRFTRTSFAALATKHGFKINYSSYLFMAVLPFYIAQRYLLKLKHGAKAAEGHLEINPLINTILYTLCQLDALIISILGRLPVGSSLFSVISK